MIPAAFDYVRAGSAEEAISLLGEHGDESKLIAGGHSLLPLMKLRLAQPSVLIDIGRLGVDDRPAPGVSKTTVVALPESRSSSGPHMSALPPIPLISRRGRPAPR